MCKYSLLILLLGSIHGIADEESCTNIGCHHDNLEVCGVRGDGSGEVAFRLFQDACALQKYGCQEGNMKVFKLVDIEYCKQAFSVNTFRRSLAYNNDTLDETNGEEVKVNIEQELTDTADTNEHNTCIQCASTSESKSICAIRPDGDHFVIRWFPDECHMHQYNCENNTYFSVTDDYICLERNYSKNSVLEEIIEEIKKEGEIKNTDNVENKKPNSTKSLTCLQNDCIPDITLICAIRPENERFRVRWFDDKCDMLEYNCENHVNFSVTDDFICIGNDSSFEVNKNPVKPLTIDTDNIISDEIAKGVKKKDLTIKGAEGYELKDRWNYTKGQIPNKVVVSTFDITTENINQTVKKLLAATHSTGLQLQNYNSMQIVYAVAENGHCKLWSGFWSRLEETRGGSTGSITVENPYLEPHNRIPIITIQDLNIAIKLEDEQTRRMIIKNTGPVNVYIPRMYRPQNYTPIEERNLTEAEKLEYTPLVHYCFHKCPKKCPDIYKPVCLGRAGDPTKYSPFIFVKNHCYMDYFKCMTKSYSARNTTTSFEDIGFLFCGGYKMMNMLYMFPIVRILQRMGRLKKKGKAHFVMRDLGYFPQRLQG